LLHGIANGWHGAPLAQVMVPGRPQLTQVPGLQLASRHGVAHCWHGGLPGHCGCPGAPHPWHLPLVHVNPAPHSGPLAQQYWLAPPHATQVPDAQLASGHGVAPGLHAGLPLHSGWPGFPHAVHRPRLQTPELHVDCGAAQQYWLGPPHATHVPNVQLASGHGVAPRSHGGVVLHSVWPGAPQATQVPGVQLASEHGFAPGLQGELPGHSG
jgi:hypothetical protein